MSAVEQIAAIERQIAGLKDERDRLIRESGLEQKQLERILRFRTRKQTICQLLRELHDVLEGEQQDKVGQCLLMAKKMDAQLVRYAGRRYHKDWYDDEGKFTT